MGDFRHDDADAFAERGGARGRSLTTGQEIRK
jgi:hypothetical protein